MSTARIPNGRLRRGTGRDAYNRPWHTDPEDIEMAEVTIEVCDATPAYVEDHLSEFITTIKRFAPSFVPRM